LTGWKQAQTARLFQEQALLPFLKRQGEQGAHPAAVRHIPHAKIGDLLFSGETARKKNPPDRWRPGGFAGNLHARLSAETYFLSAL
jgi:hypothetical protein